MSIQMLIWYLLLLMHTSCISTFSCRSCIALLLKNLLRKACTWQILCLVLHCCLFVLMALVTLMIHACSPMVQTILVLLAGNGLNKWIPVVQLFPRGLLCMNYKCMQWGFITIPFKDRLFSSNNYTLAPYSLCPIQWNTSGHLGSSWFGIAIIARSRSTSTKTEERCPPICRRRTMETCLLVSSSTWFYKSKLFLNVMII